ncbi:MAG: hypothetical protein OJF59_000557 [Cytophagales bacterium]|nr:MAG: hypothetical protein OJF59_000557 [Cytophagales bacterium]
MALLAYGALLFLCVRVWPTSGDYSELMEEMAKMKIRTSKKAMSC